MERSWLLLSSITSGANIVLSQKDQFQILIATRQRIHFTVYWYELQCRSLRVGYLVNLSLPANNTQTFRIMEEECLRELDFIFNLKFTMKIFILRPPAQYNVYTYLHQLFLSLQKYPQTVSMWSIIKLLEVDRGWILRIIIFWVLDFSDKLI